MDFDSTLQSAHMPLISFSIQFQFLFSKAIDSINSISQIIIGPHSRNIWENVEMPFFGFRFNNSAWDITHWICSRSIVQFSILPGLSSNDSDWRSYHWSHFLVLHSRQQLVRSYQDFNVNRRTWRSVQNILDGHKHEIFNHHSKVNSFFI